MTSNSDKGDGDYVRLIGVNKRKGKQWGSFTQRAKYVRLIGNRLRHSDGREERWQAGCERGRGRLTANFAPKYPQVDPPVDSMKAS
jgi:hypothetical protein